MSTDDFQDRLDRVQQIAEVIARIDLPEIKVEAFRYLIAAETSTPAGGQKRAPAASTKASGVAGDAEPEKQARRKSNGGSKKQTFTADRDLNFYSKAGPLKTAFKEFVELHSPASNLQKAVVAVYWLKKELEVEEVTIDQVYTAFKTLSWPIPADLANTLQQAGTKNYLDSKKRHDIKLTTHGENLVEQDLKPTAAE